MNRIEMWADLINMREFERVAEIGVWKGDFAAGILRRCPRVREYIMIDPWANQPNWNKPFNVPDAQFAGVFAEAMRKTDFAKDRRRVIRKTTLDAAREIEDGSLDFAYIDGDHTLRGISTDLISILPKVREFGMIGGDDFTPNPLQHGRKFEPTMVFPFAVHFAEAHGLPIYALPNDQFMIHKGTGGFKFMDPKNRYGELGLLKLLD